jgi:hypothetical protein
MLYANQVGTTARAEEDHPMARRVWIMLALILPCCAAPETAWMKNPATGQIASCGPYYINEWSAQFAAERACIEDYGRQGYVRVPGPDSK